MMPGKNQFEQQVLSKRADGVLDLPRLLLNCASPGCSRDRDRSRGRDLLAYDRSNFRFSRVQIHAGNGSESVNGNSVQLEIGADFRCGYN